MTQEPENDSPIRDDPLVPFGVNLIHEHLTVGRQRICVIGPYQIEAHRDGDQIMFHCTRCLEPWRVPIDESMILTARHICDDES